MPYINKLNYNADGNHIIDEEIILTGGNKLHTFAHDNVMQAKGVNVWTGINSTGTQITDFVIANKSKSWEQEITFGASVADGVYYVTYYSEGDENDADDINAVLNTLKNTSKMIARYVHSGNSVIQPVSLDKVTGIFTVDTPIDLSIGVKYNIIPVMHRFTNNILPREWSTMYSHQVELIDEYTFYVCENNVRISDYPNASNTSIDVSSFHFEYGSQNTVIDLSAFPNLSDILVKALGQRNRNGWSAINFGFTHSGGTASISPHNNPDGRDFQMFWSERPIKYIKEQGVIYGRGAEVTTINWNNSNGTWTMGKSTTAERTFDFYNDVKFTNVSTFFPMANGFVIEVYDLGGE